MDFQIPPIRNSEAELLNKWNKSEELNQDSKGSFVAVFFQKIGRWIFAEPSVKEIYRTNLITSVSLLAIIIFIFYKFGFFAPTPAPIQPGEIDLSGTWKINFSDDQNFSRKTLNDSQWCLIGVPDPNVALAKSPGDSPSSNCPKEIYPAEKMRGATYWYRKTFTISENAKFSEPSLFLGAIKNKAKIYLDGKLMGVTNIRDNASMAAVSVESAAITAGKHNLAIRVESENTKYPGIFHAFPRRVVLGEAKNNASQFNRIVSEKYLTPSMALFIQVTCLLLLLTLLAKGKGANSSFFWLAIYFAFGAIRTAPPLVEYSGSINKDIVYAITEIFISISICGFALENTEPFIEHRRVWGKILIASASICSLYFLTTNYAGVNENITLAYIIFPFSFWIFSVFLGKKLTVSKNRFFLFAALILTHTLLLAGKLSINMPIVTHRQIVNSIISVAMIYLVLDEYTKQERTLAFFGRFIRPGLKNLLQEKFSKKEYADTKVFRGRQIAIMKIDIVNHTQTTYQMPYGIKRLFQDTWFTMIDQIVADKVFLDKNIGDGSIYCFSENETEGSCNVALKTALEIRDEAIQKFDEEFYSRLKTLLEITPELKIPAEEFFAKYKERTGIEFLDRITNVRIALVYGFVDEGLWGLSGQSHYDVQGDLVSLVARLESKAEDGEILLDASFGKELGELKLRRLNTISRTVELKGMGTAEVFCLVNKKEIRKKFSA